MVRDRLSWARRLVSVGDFVKVAGKTAPSSTDRATALDHEGEVLRERASAAMERAYAPYSNFRVGAVLLGSDGSMTEGCNVESAAYPAGICAERAALGAAVARGVRSFRAIAIVTSGENPTPPCGMCRQALIEFSPELEIVSMTRSGKEARWTLANLLPHAFTPHSLDRTD
jgi:cytidine deaminase